METKGAILAGFVDFYDFLTNALPWQLNILFLIEKFTEIQFQQLFASILHFVKNGRRATN